MADNIIGTGVSDPDFYSHQASRLGGAISSIVGGWRQRQEQKAQEDQAEIDRAFKMMQQAPELADTWGAALVKKYGNQYPEVPAMVSVIQNRKALAKEIPDAGTAWETAVQRRKDEHIAAQAKAAAMPDYVDHPIGPSSIVPGPAGLALSLAGAIGPNAEKQKEMARLQQVDPNYFTGEALNDLPVHQANAARLYAKDKGIPIAQRTPFDPNRDLPNTERGLLASEQGLIAPDSQTAQALRVASRIEAAPAVLQQQGFQHDERLGREGEAQTMLGKREEAMRARMSLSERIAMAREDRHVADQKQLIDYRASHRASGGGKGDESGISHKDIVAASRSAATDYDHAKKDALTGLNGEERQAALAKFQQEHGKRPHVITPYAAKQLVTIAEDDEEAQSLAEELSSAVADGHSEASALRVFRQFAPGGQADPKRGAAPVAAKAPTIGKAGKPVARPKAPSGAADEARGQAKKMFPGLSAQQIEEKVKQFMAEHYG